ncbi:hypothetical protein FXW78_18645 [Rhodococcus opacus]|nr:hypothetical protein [Rhodococcus opacus]
MTDTLSCDLTAVDAEVTVYLNTTVDGLGRPLGMIDGYRPSHTFERVLTYQVRTVSTVGGINAALEQVFFDLNVGTTRPSSPTRNRPCCSTAASIVVAHCRSTMSSNCSAADTPSRGPDSSGSATPPPHLRPSATNSPIPDTAAAHPHGWAAAVVCMEKPVAMLRRTHATTRGQYGELAHLPRNSERDLRMQITMEDDPRGPDAVLGLLISTHGSVARLERPHLRGSPVSPLRQDRENRRQCYCKDFGAQWSGG